MAQLIEYDAVAILRARVVRTAVDGGIAGRCAAERYLGHAEIAVHSSAEGARSECY